MNMTKVSIIGAGTWALGIAVLLYHNGEEITVWSALEEELEMLRDNHEHKNLPGVRIPEEINLESDLEAAVKSADVLVMAVASPYTRQTAARMASFVTPGQIIVDVAKGIEENTLMTLSEQILDEIPQANVAVLSGPSHAEEVSRGIPTTCVVGASDQKTAEYLQNLFMSEVFRVYTSPDIKGIELGGSLKNVIALAAGVEIGRASCRERV